MHLKEYQQRTLAQVRNYLEHLADRRKKALDNPGLVLDFTADAWTQAASPHPYHPCKNGLGEPLPTFCLKIPTGGGKTLLAVKTVDLVNTVYRRHRTGLVLWIVPSTQIYRQTIQSLKDRDHPYRQHLDLASSGHTLILEKTDRFAPQDMAENLVVLMLMLPSANRKTKETLRVFKDSGGFQDFFPAEDDIRGQEALLQRFPNLDTYEKQSAFWGRQIKTSLGNTLRMLSPLIVLDEGHKAYSAGAQETLRGFNPCLIVELSATPSKESNVLVDICGMDLLREEMIKLDLHVINKASVDWKETLLAGVSRRNLLEDKARQHEANAGVHIRPICLIQVERTGHDQKERRWIHADHVREHLIKTLGIPAEQVAVKTSDKDELKEVDDVGGLMSRNCAVRYIITKQALQEGWDCAFAYVLVVLTNPSSKNALTQLVGRILRQPFARKTRIRDLDESYVFCFQQRADVLLESIRTGFKQEGLGDLHSHVAEDSDDEVLAGEDRIVEIRERFRQAAGHTILPVFVVKGNGHWRPVNYEMDIASHVPWDQVNLEPLMDLRLSMVEEKDLEHVTTLADSPHEVVRQREVIRLREGGIRVDSVFMTQQLRDIVANPWQAHRFAKDLLDSFRERADERSITNNFVFLIEELRRNLEHERDRLAEQVFRSLLEKNQLRFLIIGDDLAWTFPKKIAVKRTAQRLNRKDQSPLQLSLFDLVPEEDLNETEKAVAWYLEDQTRLFFWYRNRVRHDYGIQGWRRNRIYPDFIFTTTDEAEDSGYDRVYVVETKGLHLKDADRTVYTRKLFDLCTRQAKARHWTDLGQEMKDKVLRFEVLGEDDWRGKLNGLLA